MSKWTIEQLQAINESGKNIIVSAGAGSGKTAVLTERVIEKIKNGCDIDSLLILTFTRAAANEMKERIRNKIKEHDYLKDELEKIDNAYITTFDSFSLSIVKKYYYLLKVPVSIGIGEASIISLLKEKYMNEVFEEMYSLDDLDFNTFVGDFCLKDDLELREYTLKLSNELDLRYDKEEYLDNYIENHFNEDKLNMDSLNYVNFLKDKIKIIKELVDNFTTLVDSDFINKVYEALNPLLLSETYEDIKNNINVSFPRLKNGSTDDVKKKKEQITSEIKSLSDFTKYECLEEVKSDIKSTLPYVRSIIKIIKKFDNKLNNYKKEHDLYEFTDIAKMAIKVVSENDDVRIELKNKFSEILLDEYQDTSDLQETFISLISNNNVYMVGDIKQSIYRFRNANPKIFKDKYNNYKNNNGGIKIDLMKNFRSRREVLNNINQIFNHIMDNEIGEAEYMDGHQMIFGNTSYEELGSTIDNHNFEYLNYEYEKETKFKKEEIEAFIIASDIKKKIESNYQIFDKENGILRNIEYKDFVILIDRTKNFNLYKKIFEHLNIPLMLYKDESLSNSYDLNIIKNIIKLIIKKKENNYDTEFKYAFTSVARSYLVNLSDNLIFESLNNNNYDVEFMNHISFIANKIDEIDNKEIFKLIIDEFDYYNKIIKIGDIKGCLVRLEYINNLMDSLSSLGYDIYDLLDYLENIINKNLDINYSVSNDSLDAVKIMTIHKSKGLEYHICYFPSLYEEFNSSELKDRFCYTNKYGIITPIVKNGIKESIYKIMYKSDYLIDEISEKIRLLYVALTRAKEKMIFIGNIKDIDCGYNSREIIDNYTRLKYRSFEDIFDSIKPFIQSNIINVDINNLNITRDYNLIKKINYKNNINDQIEPIIVNEINTKSVNTKDIHYSKEIKNILTKENKDNLKFGTYMHFLLELIDFKNPNIDSLNINSFYKDKLKAFLNQDIFKQDIINIYKEFEFIYEEDNIKKHGIIDLILELEDKYIIIDYKTKNISDSSYKEQLLGYKNYLESITSKKVEIYLYSIMDKIMKKI